MATCADCAVTIIDIAVNYYVGVGSVIVVAAIGVAGVIVTTCTHGTVEVVVVI